MDTESGNPIYSGTAPKDSNIVVEIVSSNVPNKEWLFNVPPYELFRTLHEVPQLDFQKYGMSNPCKKGDCDFDVVSNNSMAKVHKIVVNIALCKMKVFIATHVLNFGILQKMKIGHMVGQYADDFWDNKIDNGNLFFKISTLSSDETSGMAEVSIDFTKYMQFHMYIQDDRVLKAADFFCKC
jgi:hypothetical protein